MDPRPDPAKEGRLDPRVVEDVARLARLDLDEAEQRRYAEQLGAILRHFAVLSELDTEGVEPAVYAIDLEGRTRRDAVEESGPSPEELLGNAPLLEERFYKVPRVIE